MNLFCNVINSHLETYKKTALIKSFLNFLFIFFVSFSFFLTLIPPEEVYASKKNSSFTKSKKNSHTVIASKCSKKVSNSDKKNSTNSNTNIKKISKKNGNSNNSKKSANKNKSVSKSKKNITKNDKRISKTNKNKSVSVSRKSIISNTNNAKKYSEMLAYFSKVTGNKIDNYNEYKSVIKKRETIVDILKPYGLSNAEIIEFSKKNKKSFNVKQIKAGRQYCVISHKNSGKKANYLVYENSPKRYVILPIHNFEGRNSNDTSSSEICDNSINEPKDSTLKDSGVKIKHVSAIVKTNLHKTTSKMGFNKKLTNQLASIYRNTNALANLRKGDLIQVAYQEKYVNGKLVKTGVITSAIITTRDKSYHAYRFTYNGKHGYYDENGSSLESSFLKAPLQYREITSGFSTRRFHPIKHIYQPHPGIDYAAPTGTPVKSVGDGIVIFKGYADSAGNYLKIRHSGTGISEYMHLSKFHKSIKVNKKVSKGEVIGFVGATGYATGPHLDLRFMVNNKYVDYRKLKLPHGEPLPRQFRNLFFQHVAMVNKQWNKVSRRELSFNANGHSNFKTSSYVN